MSTPYTEPSKNPSRFYSKVWSLEANPGRTRNCHRLLKTRPSLSPLLQTKHRSSFFMRPMTHPLLLRSLLPSGITGHHTAVSLSSFRSYPRPSLLFPVGLHLNGLQPSKEPPIPLRQFSSLLRVQIHTL